MKRAVTVTVAGQKLAIKTSARSKYVRELAALVTEKVDEVKAAGRPASTQATVLLAAMNLADELLQLRESHRQLKLEVRERSKRILRQLDAQLGS